MPFVPTDTMRRARRALTSNQTSPALVPGAQRGKIVVLVTDGCEDDDRAVEKEGVLAVLEGIYIISVTVSEAYLGILKKISQQILELRTDIDWRSTVACPGQWVFFFRTRAVVGMDVVEDGRGVGWGGVGWGGVGWGTPRRRTLQG